MGEEQKQWHRAWAVEVLRILKPGAHLVAFGGTRTYHRLACAIEDAGFEIRDSLMWIYGSGFPKSLNLDGDWEGWGTALKPGHEPIVLARKPLAGTVAANVLEHGTGALNVDGCRIGTERRFNAPAGNRGDEPASVAPVNVTAYRGSEVAGRWPPNLLLTHSADCGEECAEGCPVREMDRQSGEGQSRIGIARASTEPGEGWGMTKTGAEYADSGGASRFFPRFRYEAKANSGERNAGLGGVPEVECQTGCGGDMPIDDEGRDRDRFKKRASNHHPTVKPVALMRWLCRLVTPPGGLILDPFLGSGTTIIAALQEGFRCVGIEREAEYVEIARRRVEEDMPLFNRERAS